MAQPRSGSRLAQPSYRFERFRESGRDIAPRGQRIFSQRFQDRSRASGRCPDLDPGREWHAADPAQQKNSVKVMKPYIGTPTSRVDGRAKVTGLAQYAGEFKARDLAYGSVVTSTIARGRIAHMDTSQALAVKGVIDVLTHENRPRMASTDEGYNDEVAPGGSPFRPLYDDRIKFNGQPIAVVIAEEWEIARFAATLVNVEYHAENHATDLHARF